MPEGYVAELYPETEPELLRIEENRTLQTVDSFIDYVKAFLTDQTVIFIDDYNQGFQAIFDYHQGIQPYHCKFKAGYSCPPSDEWKEWNDNNKRKMNQVDFAQFLETNIALKILP